MHAAGRVSGICASWSSISETRGLMTSESPSPRTIDVRIYAKDFPEAVYETKRVELPLRMLIIV